MKYNLIVKDLRKLSNDIYQNENCIDNEKMANEMLESMIKQLGIIVEFMEWIYFNDFIEDLNDNHLGNLWGEIDVNQLGDLINLLNVIDIKECE